MRIKQYQVDAFASVLFTGNPAAVCVLDTWLPTEKMQAIAQENNLSETAFIVPDKDTIGLRWFTPVSEVDLCGHATLASAHVLFEHLHYTSPLITFQTLSGELTVRRHNNRLQMDFPQRIAKRCNPSPTTLLDAFGQMPDEVWAADDYLLIFDHETTLQSLQPDFTLLATQALRGVIVTAPSHTYDFVSRFFAPKLGIPEDPVTGSAHCTLTPYWSQRLNKTELIAKQCSPRGGVLHCTLQENRVLISGHAVTFMEATLML